MFTINQLWGDALKPYVIWIFDLIWVACEVHKGKQELFITNNVMASRCKYIIVDDSRNYIHVIANF